MANKVFRYHLALIAALLAVHLTTKLIYFTTGQAGLLGMAPLFDFVGEQSIPNFFSASAMLAIAVVAALIARNSSERGSRLHNQWRFVTLVALFLAFDEGAGIHDQLSLPGQSALASRGVFFIGWVLPYAALVSVVAYLMWPLAKALPAATRNQLILAAGVYISSAMGMEMLEAVQMDRSSKGGSLADVDFWAINHTPSMVALVTVEETGEMLGIALALRALLSYLTVDLGVRLFLAGPPAIAYAGTQQAPKNTLTDVLT